MFERAALIGIRNDNNTKRTESHEEFRKNVYPLRSFLRCSICGLRMHARSRRATHAYVCSTSSRQPGLVPEGHPKYIYLNEKKAGEKIIDFLHHQVFGPERVSLLRDALLSSDPEGDEAAEEAARVTKELNELRNRMKRLMANFESEEPGSELLRDFKLRLTELADMRAKKERELESAQQVVQERPDPETAEGTISALPLIAVDWDRLLEEDFRDLLQTLNFEARYDVRTNELAVQVVLIPELLLPDEPVNSSVSFVHPTVQNAKNPPQLVGEPFALVERQSKLRRAGYRRL